ncbi:peptide/nickel transport system permease protein [Actinomadura hallensis]|uniref:Peptide/nickel transport system permease protein n=1 Tax=Actinomadura hallensis TaxID=337895 RepID=A0A543IFK9_9ACTN|nr:ABC transporter permease [Actinomadura hallensis]TQM69375.1 peptide/nickel transport system permease protein [Actinomadura hallensis]HLV74481.1 ABC transporter permease [Vulgatibacteraceae bacterium]
MIAFFIRRLVGGVVMLLVISAVTFLIFFGLPRAAGQSTDQLAARFAGKSPTAETITAIKERFGFDDPLAVQYGNFLKSIVAGDTYDTGVEKIDCPAPCLGYSFRTNQSVTEQIVDRFPITLSLVVGAAIIWLLAGVSIGVLSALKRGSLFDRAAMIVALAGVSLPIFFTGLLSLTFVVHAWELLPPVSYHSFMDNPFKWASALILPWVTLAFLYAAMYARLTRAGMLETMGEDYIRTARAKGLPERTVITRHALRASLTPVLTIFGLDVGLLFGGAILTEQTFSLKGLGNLALEGVIGSDLPVVLGTVVTLSLAVIVMNLVVDVMYGILDPRVRLS